MIFSEEIKRYIRPDESTAQKCDDFVHTCIELAADAELERIKDDLRNRTRRMEITERDGKRMIRGEKYLGFAIPEMSDCEDEPRMAAHDFFSAFGRTEHTEDMFVLHTASPESDIRACELRMIFVKTKLARDPELREERVGKGLFGGCSCGSFRGVSHVYTDVAKRYLGILTEKARACGIDLDYESRLECFLSVKDYYEAARASLEERAEKKESAARKRDSRSDEEKRAREKERREAMSKSRICFKDSWRSSYLEGMKDELPGIPNSPISLGSASRTPAIVIMYSVDI